MEYIPPGGRVGDVSSCCRLKFWGVRGSIPTPGPSTLHYGGNTSCIEVRADGELIILDAGTGIRPLGKALAEEFKGRALDATILFSHTHWDHIQGFPFFLPAYIPGNRVRLFGFDSAPETFQETLSNQMTTPYFPVALAEMQGGIEVSKLDDLEFQIGRVRVRATSVNHPGIAAGYRLETSRGSIVYLPDHEPSGCTAAAAGADPQAEAEAMELDKPILDFVRDADVLVIDSQYDDSEYADHVGWGHGCLSIVVKTAVQSNVKRLYLFHHDPNHDDAQVTAMLEDARQMAIKLGSKIIIEAAREGDEFELEP